MATPCPAQFRVTQRAPGQFEQARRNGPTTAGAARADRRYRPGGDLATSGLHQSLILARSFARRPPTRYYDIGIRFAFPPSSRSRREVGGPDPRLRRGSVFVVYESVAPAKTLRSPLRATRSTSGAACIGTKIRSEIGKSGAITSTCVRSAAKDAAALRAAAAFVENRQSLHNTGPVRIPCASGGPLRRRGAS